MAFVDVLDDTFKARHVTAQVLDQIFHVRDHVRCRYQADHDFSRVDADATHDMTDDARPSVFVVGRNLEIFHPLADDGGDDVIAFFLNGAVFDVDDFMGRGRKTADGDVSLTRRGDGKLHLIAVIPRRLSAEDGQDVDALQMADAFHGVFYLLAFFLQFPFIAEVLKLTAAAAFVYRTGRLFPIRRRREDLF